MEDARDQGRDVLRTRDPTRGHEDEQPEPKRARSELLENWRKTEVRRWSAVFGTHGRRRRSSIELPE